MGGRSRLRGEKSGGEEWTINAQGDKRRMEDESREEEWTINAEGDKRWRMRAKEKSG